MPFSYAFIIFIFFHYFNLLELVCIYPFATHQFNHYCFLPLFYSYSFFFSSFRNAHLYFFPLNIEFFGGCLPFCRACFPIFIVFFLRFKRGNFCLKAPLLFLFFFVIAIIAIILLFLFFYVFLLCCVCVFSLWESSISI